MVTMGKSMNVASRLAAATALTGTLAACDGRFGRAADEMFAPISSETAEAPAVSAAPAKPGNPVYVGGSQAANDALYQQTYGAPIQGSGQTISNPNQVGYADSVYQDSSISATPITDIPGGPVIDAGVPTYGTVITEPTYNAAPIPVETGGYSTPSGTYTAPTSPAFPSIGSEPVYLPQSSLPQSASPQSQLFTDASASGGLRDIEPLLDMMPNGYDEPYGSTASVRYTAAEETLPTVNMTTQAPAYSMPVEMIEAQPLAMTETVGSYETVEVAALGGAFMPIPRVRPARAVTVIETASVASPVPTARPAMMRTPLPTLRPMQLAAVSGQAITDAPALTEAPKMIDMGPIFLDDEEAPQMEVAALAPAPAPEKPKSDAPELTVIKPENLESEMAALDTSKIDTGDAMKADVQNTQVAALEAPATAPKVEVAGDVGELKELSGTSWRLASLNGADVSAEAELHFDGTSGFAGGQGICNNYGGEFSETLKGEFDMANIFSTETECDDYAMEKQYIVALEKAAAYRMAPGLKELMLLGPDGKTVATFSAF